MPCDRRIIISLDLRAKDPKILFDALKDMEIIRNRHRLRTDEQLMRFCEQTVASGKVSVLEGGEQVVRDIQRAYSQKAVQVAARRMGWKVQSGKDKNRLTLSR